MNRNLIFLLFVFSVVLLGVESIQGKTIRVSDIEIKGNKHLSDGKILSAIETGKLPWYASWMPWVKKPVFDEETFLNDLLRIEKLYEQEGYLQARVSNYEQRLNAKGDKVKLVVYIDEGPVTRVRDVRFTYRDSSAHRIPVEKLARKVILKGGKRYREEDLRLDYNRLMQEFGNRGFPYVKVRVRPLFDHTEHVVDLEWIVTTGPYSYFGDISFTGNRHISTKAIRRGLGFRPGEPFSQKKLLTAQSQVYRLELFQFVSLQATDLDSMPNRIPIQVKVKESTLRTLKFGLGYGSEEAFRASVQWRHRNFLGGARILRAQIKHSTRLMPISLEVQLSQPYFLDNRNDLLVKPFFTIQDEKSFKARRLGLETTLSRQLSQQTNLFFTAIAERDTVEIKSESAVAAEQLDDLYNKSIFRVGYRRNTTDQLFTPTRGSITTVIVENSGQFLEAPRKYNKISIDQRFFTQIRRGTVFAARLMVGMMGSAGSGSTPVEERFFSGGSVSVRGWARQRLGPVVTVTDSSGRRVFTPIGGNSLLEGNLELRYPLIKDFSAVTFLDFGNVWPEFDGFDLTDLHYALGSGLRYNTVIGPVRMDFAWKLNKQPQDTRNWEIHFSIGHAF